MAEPIEVTIDPAKDYAAAVDEINAMLKSGMVKIGPFKALAEAAIKINPKVWEDLGKSDAGPTSAERVQALRIVKRWAYNKIWAQHPPTATFKFTILRSRLFADDIKAFDAKEAARQAALKVPAEQLKKRQQELKAELAAIDAKLPKEA